MPCKSTKNGLHRGYLSASFVVKLKKFHILLSFTCCFLKNFSSPLCYFHSIKSTYFEIIQETINCLRNSRYWWYIQTYQHCAVCWEGVYYKKPTCGWTGSTLGRTDCGCAWTWCFVAEHFSLSPLASSSHPTWYRLQRSQHWY